MRILIITLNASGRAAVQLYYVITYNIMYDVMTLARYKLSWSYTAEKSCNVCM